MSEFKDRLQETVKLAQQAKAIHDQKAEVAWQEENLQKKKLETEKIERLQALAKEWFDKDFFEEVTKAVLNRTGVTHTTCDAQFHPIFLKEAESRGLQTSFSARYFPGFNDIDYGYTDGYTQFTTRIYYG